MKVQLPKGRGHLEVRELAELLAASAQPIKDGDSEDHSDYFEWAVALQDWYAAIETALQSGQLHALHPVSKVPTVRLPGDSDPRSYVVLRGVAEQWIKSLGQQDARPESDAAKKESPPERAKRFLARHDELKKVGDKAPTLTLAAEEGVHASRIRQILQTARPEKAFKPKANNPFGQGKKASKR